MLLEQGKSKCTPNQKIIVSKDKGEMREHRAINPKQMYSVRQYQLDGELIKQQTCCDYLVLNDTLKKAYLIELKGKRINDAVIQLEAGENKCKEELKDYIFHYRIVASKTKTLDMRSPKFRKFQEKHGNKFKYKTNFLEETLD